VGALSDHLVFPSWSAWFVDPGGNVLAVVQPKG
jgi:predicted enzyme related to lactoylglutathione lyase